MDNYQSKHKSKMYYYVQFVIFILFCQNSYRLFSGDEDEPSGLETVAQIVRFTDDLCSTALTLSGSHVVMQHMVLNFYEVVSIYK